MSEATLKTILAEMRMMRDEVEDMRGEMSVMHQKIDGLSVLLTMLAGAQVYDEDDDDFGSLMDDVGEDNPQ
ncbi:hypothetical protein [Roseivivax isoporae]|uniref:Uncharacterized protein n=1 Tax=Roseivivax isoporae LMG 25204 TaxID=1449351 RepID=X7FBK5_9RHOB|nr:hypothetical protein [Roseivivax isoporae]ETX29486.1 hypothetical protein RISW2_23405 [Roseivivax isoporae LMG 25204]